MARSGTRGCAWRAKNGTESSSELGHGGVVQRFRGFRTCTPESGRETEGSRRETKEGLTVRLSQPSFGLGAAGDDEGSEKLRNGHGGAELVVEVLGLLGLVLGVAEVEEGEVDVLVCSAELHGVPASTAFSAPSPNSPDFQRRQKGI